ncbi:hypothetical protein Y597_4947 [Burkholderia pseudomallei MSHR1000]|nr:hypothetical protein Y597_4947 [Burkholderia pseudomallei MSHR1000]
MPGRARLHALVAAFADVAAQRLRHDIRHSRYLRSGDRQPPTANRQPTTDNRQPTTDNRQPTTDNRQPEPLPNQTESPTALNHRPPRPFPTQPKRPPTTPTPSILMPREPRVALVLDLLQQVVE